MAIYSGFGTMDAGRQRSMGVAHGQEDRLRMDVRADIFSRGRRHLHGQRPKSIDVVSPRRMR